MEKQNEHITSYFSHGKILVILLLLTALTVSVTLINLTAFTVTIALTIASVKGFLVMYHFMHLKHEQKIFKVVGFGVVILFGLIVFITFLDYMNR